MDDVKNLICKLHTYQEIFTSGFSNVEICVPWCNAGATCPSVSLFVVRISHLHSFWELDSGDQHVHYVRRNAADPTAVHNVWNSSHVKTTSYFLLLGNSYKWSSVTCNSLATSGSPNDKKL